jgi:hypothetical protein
MGAILGLLSQFSSLLMRSVDKTTLTLSAFCELPSDQIPME